MHIKALRRLGIVWLLAMGLTLLLAACGATATNTAGTAATTAPAAAATTAPAAAATTAASSAATTAPAAAATTAASTSGQTGPAPTVAPVPNGNKTGVTDTEILIGSFGPQTGPASQYGVIDRTVDAYFKMINEQGGINGRKIKFIYEDDAYNPARSVEVVKKLVEQDKVFAFIAGLGTAPNLAVQDYITEKGVPHYYPATGTSALVQPIRKNQFALQLDYTTESTILAQYMAGDLKSKKIAIFYQDDPFGKEGLNGVKAAAAKAGFTVTSEVPYATTEKDFAPLALKLKQGDPDSVIMWSIPSATAATLKEMDKIGFKPKIGVSAVNNDASLFQLAGSSAESIYTMSWLPDPNSNEPKVVKYREFMQKYAPKEAPNSGFGLTAYAASEIFVEALKRAGKDLSRESFIAALETIKDYGEGIVFKISYSATSHSGVKTGYIQQAKNAKFEKISDFIELKP